MAVTSCGQVDSIFGNDDSESSMQDMLLFSLLVVAFNPPPVQAYVDKVAVALDTWGIGLQTGVLANFRTTNTSYVLNPPNWITVADSSCNARGIPLSWQGAGCSLAGNVIGVCITRYYTTGDVGKLVDTTLIMLDTYQASTSVSDANKQSVFTHEVGHCLGLRHAEVAGAPKCNAGSAYVDCIMYPSTAGADTPHSDELTAMQAAYNPMAIPSPATNFDRFSLTGGVAVRHWQFPVFTVSSVIGSAMTDENAIEKVAPSIALEGDVEVRVHKYKRDGSFEVQTFDQHGNLL